jgi:radical SAM superfamily enzyme YgiQ (UPF0313 family)
MDILFLIPPRELNKEKMPVDRVYGCNYGFDYKPAIHLLLLATVAEDSGCNVRFLDCPAQGYNFRKFSKYIADNQSIDMVVFFTVWLSAQEDLLAAEKISELIKKVKIVFTGPYPTWKPGMFIKNGNYFVIRGEPEKPLADFIKFCKSSDINKNEIQNLSFKKETEIVNNDSAALIDIDKLPMPNRKLLKGRYFFNRLNAWPATVMCVSRGCVYNCNYCAPHALDQTIELEYSKRNSSKPTMRLRSIGNVVDEFNRISSLGYRGVEICDNQFIWGKERTMEVCEKIKDLNLKWICYARADHLKDRDMLRLMRRAGCQLIYIGTESFDQAVLNDINKEMNVKDIYKAVNLVRESGIEPEVSVLLGASASETEKTILHSIKEAGKMKTKFIHYSIAAPLPNTRLYKVSKENGWLRGGEFVPIDNIRDALLDLPYVNAQRLKTIIRKCYGRKYLSLRFIMQQIFSPNFLQKLSFKIRLLFRLLKYISKIR